MSMQHINSFHNDLKPGKEQVIQLSAISVSACGRFFQEEVCPQRPKAHRSCWGLPASRAAAGRTRGSPAVPGPHGSARRPRQAEAEPLVSAAADRPPVLRPGPARRSKAGRSWRLGCSRRSYLAGGMGLDPLFQAWSYFRRRKFRQCSELCSELLERPPGEQVLGGEAAERWLPGAGGGGVCREQAASPPLLPPAGTGL